MTTISKTPGCGGRARFDSIIEMESHQYTIDNALVLALSELYGTGIVLRGRGPWQRFKPPGKRDMDGYAAILGHEAALFGRWDTGEQHLVMLGDDSMSEHERQQHRLKSREQADQAQQRQQAQREEEHDRAAERTRELWAGAIPAQDHAYLRRKQVTPGWTRQLGHLLLVPLTDGTRLINVQTIAVDGTKRFLTGGRKKGCYHPIGRFDTDRPMLICEGWATGMTLHEATGSAVACAMDAGNLLPVARYLRTRYPSVDLIVACDNDHATPGNPGITKGKVAAEAVGGRAIWPAVDGIEGASDYNDLALLRSGVAS